VSEKHFRFSDTYNMMQKGKNIMAKAMQKMTPRDRAILNRWNGLTVDDIRAIEADAGEYTFKTVRVPGIRFSNKLDQVVETGRFVTMAAVYLRADESIKRDEKKLGVLVSAQMDSHLKNADLIILKHAQKMLPITGVSLDVLTIMRNKRKVSLRADYEAIKELSSAAVAMDLMRSDKAIPHWCDERDIFGDDLPVTKLRKAEQPAAEQPSVQEIRAEREAHKAAETEAETEETVSDEDFLGMLGDDEETPEI
jgi:hypothetical protein